jgi:hypothetical protein
VHIALKSTNIVDIPTVLMTNTLEVSGVAMPLSGVDAKRSAVDMVEFRANGSLAWEQPHYDGLRVLLKKFPPPIRLPRSVTVARADKLPNEDVLLEGKRWTLTWVDNSTKILVGDVMYPVHCAFSVYHKFDKQRGEANWRIFAVIKPKNSSLPPGGVSSLEKLSSVTLLIPSDEGIVAKDSVLTLGANNRKNNLVRPEDSHESTSGVTYSHLNLSAHEFEWVMPDREGFARAYKRSVVANADLLEREHFRTQPTVYRFAPHSCATWFKAELRDAALMGIPRCSLIVPISQEGRAFVDAAAERFRCQPGPRIDGGYQLCDWALPAFADNEAEFTLPKAYGENGKK